MGFANLLLSKNVLVTFELMPDAVHMHENTDDNFYARAMELGRERRVWEWIAQILDGRIGELSIPNAYALTYNDVGKPEASEKAMVTMEPLVESVSEAGASSVSNPYQVQKGDSLWKIAAKLLGAGARWPEIYETNRSVIQNPSYILVGTVLQIPPK